jgi:hypothetical protein
MRLYELGAENVLTAFVGLFGALSEQAKAFTVMGVLLSSTGTAAYALGSAARSRSIADQVVTNTAQVQANTATLQGLAVDVFDVRGSMSVLESNQIVLICEQRLPPERDRRDCTDQELERVRSLLLQGGSGP